MIIVECVDDGCEGFYRITFNGETYQSEDLDVCLHNVLGAMGHEVMYVSTEEFGDKS